MRSPLPALFAALMVLTAAWPAGQAGFAAVAPATAAVLIGLFYRPAATVAVVLTAAALAVLAAPALFAAASGVAATAYLITRHATDAGGIAIPFPTAVGVVAFTAAGLLGAAIPLRLTWAPLLVPALAAAILVVVGAPLLRGPRRGPADRDAPH